MECLHFSLIPTRGVCLCATLACVSASATSSAPAQSPARPASTGFSVDNTNRNDVLGLWHSTYQASEGYEKRVKWTGNYTGNNGTTSRTFLDDVERRVNYFRAMCGVPSNARVNTGSTVFRDPADAHKPSASTLKSTAAQASALMLIRNYNPTSGSDPAITHDPASSLIGWSDAAWNANAHGNLAFGIYGPGAITEYLVEELSAGYATSSWNTLVGHRRWTLLPGATDFATGDQPGKSAERPPTNVLYVSQNPAELKADPTPGFVAYPPPGYFPAPVNSRYWSLSRADADFSSAHVKVTDAAGKPVTLKSVKSDGGYGDPALIWEVAGTAAAKSVYGDQRFQVTVTGIGGTGIPGSCSYAVTLIHPDRITSNQSLAGPSTAVSNHNTFYQFTPPVMAQAIQVTAFLRKSSSWTEGAENSPKARVIDHTSKIYPLRAKMANLGGFGVISGSYAFHLTFPTTYDLLARGVPDQSFEIDRAILTKTNAKLQFRYRRGYMTKGSTLAVEVSSNGGVTWKRAGNPIKGASNTRFDNAISTATIKLPKTNLPLRVRFRYFTKPGTPIYTHEASPGQPTGIYLDDITTRNCMWLDPAKTTTLATAANQHCFNSATAGIKLAKGQQWCLAMRTKLGGHWFPYGPMRKIRIK